MPRAKPRKRPCTVCRRWFLPNPRQKERQKTCGRAECQRERHRRQCQKWNKQNIASFKANYLTEKLDPKRAPPDSAQKQSVAAIANSRIQLWLPRALIVEKIGREHFIILEYILAQVIGHNSGKIRGRRPP